MQLPLNLITLSNVYNIYVNSNVLSKIYANLLKNQFLPKVVQAIYNTFTVYHIHCTYLYLKYPSVKKVMIMQASICILQSNTFLLSISLTLIGRSCKSSRAVKKSVLKVTTKKLEEREKSINIFTKTHQVTWRHSNYTYITTCWAKQFAPNLFCNDYEQCEEKWSCRDQGNGLRIKIANWIVDTIMLNDIQNSNHGNGINVHSAINISVNKIILIWD